MSLIDGWMDTGTPAAPEGLTGGGHPKRDPDYSPAYEDSGASQAQHGVSFGEGGLLSDPTIKEFIEQYPGYAYIYRLALSGGAGDPTGRPQDAYYLLQILSEWIQEHDSVNDDGLWTTDAASLSAALTELEGLVLQSDWYKNRAPELREALIYEYQDPAGWANSVKENSEDIRRAARALGIDLSEQEVASYARQSIQEGWDENFLEEELAQEKYEDGFKPTTGSIRALYNQLVGFANNQLVADVGSHTDSLWDMAWAIARGDDTLANAEQAINSIAATDWQLPGWDFNTEWQQNQETLDRRLNGVRSTIARLWGMSPSGLDLAGLGSSFLVTGEGDGRRLITAHEAEAKARMDERFLSGPVYQSELAGVGRGLMRMMEQ
jgi:hypothetical protein